MAKWRRNEACQPSFVEASPRVVCLRTLRQDLATGRDSEMGLSCLEREGRNQPVCSSGGVQPSSSAPWLAPLGDEMFSNCVWAGITFLPDKLSVALTRASHPDLTLQLSSAQNVSAQDRNNLKSLHKVFLISAATRTRGETFVGAC